MWPKPLLHKHERGLLPLVKVSCICDGSWTRDKFSQELLDYCTQGPFFALTNVRELTIDGLGTPSFMPGIRRYF